MVPDRPLMLLTLLRWIHFYLPPESKSVGTCSYLAMQSRPDILYAVNTLARKTKTPNQEDWDAINRVLNYIAGTKHLGLLLSGGEGIKLYCTVDASYASHSDFKSQTRLHSSSRPSFCKFPFLDKEADCYGRLFDCC